MNKWEALKTILEVYTKAKGSRGVPMVPQHILTFMYMAEDVERTGATKASVEAEYNGMLDHAHDRTCEFIQEHEERNPPAKRKWWDNIL